MGTSGPVVGEAGATTVLQAWAATGTLGVQLQQQQQEEQQQQQQAPAQLVVQDWCCPALVRLVRQVADGRAARSGCSRWVSPVPSLPLAGCTAD